MWSLVRLNIVLNVSTFDRYFFANTMASRRRQSFDTVVSLSCQDLTPESMNLTLEGTIDRD